MSRVTLFRLLCGLLFLGIVRSSTGAQPIGFEERFALAEDRSTVLEELIPGTEEYYYYHCLHAQQTGDGDKVAELLGTWRKRHGESGRFRTMAYRQALLDFDGDPGRALKFLRDELGLRFDHTRQLPGEKPSWPTTVAPEEISVARFQAETMSRHGGGLEGFDEFGLRSLAVESLTSVQQRDLLSRLHYPDYPDLVNRTVADLRVPRHSGFGTLAIHKALLLDQLEACLGLMPELIQNQSFQAAYLARLSPALGVDFDRDESAREDYLDRAVAFTRRLGPAQNSLKAHFLYHRLDEDRRRGKYDRERFLEYLRLPRPTPYTNPRYLRSADHRQHPAHLKVAKELAGLYPPVRDDSALVGDYLAHFFVSEDGFEAYARYVKEDVLERIFAETKIVNGIGDLERWYSVLDDPAAYEALKNRVDLDFAPTNRSFFRSDEPVSLEVDVKNVPTLLVKVYQLNALNYYRQLAKEIEPGLSLDGLVANHEQTLEYGEPSWRRIRRSFDLPELARPGVYVVEFIGGGKGSRAVIHKGRLRYVERPGSAGHVFRVLDDGGRPVTESRLWLQGREFLPDESGEIVVPYSTRGGRQPIVLSQGSGPDAQATLESFEHRAEDYSLEVAFHLDRETLVSGRKARMIIRARLRLHDVTVSPSLFESPKLILTARDRDGVETRQETSSFVMAADGEFVHEFLTPPRLDALAVSLEGQVRCLTRGEPQKLSGSSAKIVNAIDGTIMHESPFLVRDEAGYHVEVRGKTGEARAHRRVQVSLTRRGFLEARSLTLQTDEGGRIGLGPLDGMTLIQASLGQEFPHFSWDLKRSPTGFGSLIHAAVGDAIRVPLGEDLGDSTVSLFELRVTPVGERAFLADEADRVSVVDGYLVLSGLPAGDHLLRLRPTNSQVLVRVRRGTAFEDRLLAPRETLQVSDLAPLNIRAVTAGSASLSIALANADENTRVHIVATEFVGSGGPAADLGWLEVDPRYTFRDVARSQYLTGRKLSDEYRYILARQRSKKFPGNMLERPGLILNPWSRRDTETGRLSGQAGSRWGAPPGSARPSAESIRFFGQEMARPFGEWANFEFLPASAVVLANLRPDANGQLSISRTELGGHRLVRVLAVDEASYAQREVVLGGAPLEPRDLTLQESFPADEHFTEQDRVSAMRAGESLVVKSFATASLETYDSLDDVFRLFSSLTSDEHLAEFGFLLDWPGREEADKRKLYSRYACHELNLFLARKDPEFFDRVVFPYLAHKKAPTFVDRYLLEEDLTEYLDPWRYSRLNTLEKILLAGRIPGEPSATARHLRELVELRPVSAEDRRRWFQSAILGRALELETPVERLRSLARSPRLALEEEAGGDKGGVDKLESKELAKKPRADLDMKKKSRRGSGRERGRQQEDLARRKSVKRFFRTLPPTQELAESNYYRLPREEESPERVPPNDFWTDLAVHRSGGSGSFLSVHVAEATSSFTEMMGALAFLDLPFQAAEPEMDLTRGELTLKPKGDLLVFHREIRPAGDGETLPILVSQNFFQNDDRYFYEGSEKRDRFVTDEFLVQRVYGCQVVVTNPTSSAQKLELLLQIPAGAMPVSGGAKTRGVFVELLPYSTQNMEYFFYFPRPGDFSHYPLQVARDGAFITSAASQRFSVVDRPTRVDTESWSYVSQQGSDDDVLEFLERNNLERIDLSAIAWRFRGRSGYDGLGQKVLELLRRRHVYEESLWSYGVHHQDVPVIVEFLRHWDSFVARCGSWLRSRLLETDPVERRWYEHFEYAPLVNARARALGAEREIPNQALRSQYRRLLDHLCQKPALDDEDWLAVVYYLHLQDRTEEALVAFPRVRRDRIRTRLQYDYVRAYGDLFSASPQVARQIVAEYKNYPIDRWRARFAMVGKHLDEAEGRDIPVGLDLTGNGGPSDDSLASTEPSFDLSVESRRVAINYRNVTECRVNYYRMDVEVLFSSQPFVRRAAASGGGLEQWAAIQPSRSDRVELPSAATFAFDLPEEFHASNVIVEVVAAGKRKAQAYYANTLDVQMAEQYGQLRVTSGRNGRPLPMTYVKVYARSPDGRHRFYKDGYTDLRGRFDYVSLSTSDLEQVGQFALLILHDEEGATIREAGPPPR